MSQSKFPARIRYEYEQDPAARLQYAHGVWGGINPQGEIEINFYLESDKLPPFSERQVEPRTVPSARNTRLLTKMCAW